MVDYLSASSIVNHLIKKRFFLSKRGSEMKKLMVLMLGFLLVATASLSALGADEATDCAKDVRPVVRPLFDAGKQQGKDLSAIIKEVLASGPNLCGVLVVAVESGYAPEDVLRALVGAGIETDVVVRSALDAGYSPEVIAAVVGADKVPGLGYTPAPGGGATVAPPAAVNGGRGGSVSPSTL